METDTKNEPGRGEWEYIDLSWENKMVIPAYYFSEWNSEESMDSAESRVL
jgi:hypothetical protein